MGDSPASQISRQVPRMYRVAYRLLADADQANDVVQEACVKALAHLGQFNGRAALATWLHRITVNCARDALRARGRQNNAQAALLAQSGSPAREHSPALVVEMKELSDLAFALLEKLPDDCRSAFALTQLDGYTYAEAAEIEGQPRGTMASRVFRAKKILQEQMHARLNERRQAR